MIKVAICEDEQKDREKIYELVQEYAKIEKIEYSIELFESGEQFLENKYEPDILFLDIVMNEKDGIQVGTELKRRLQDVIIIYTTNLNEKMSVAINRVHAFGYLEKPIVKKRLYDIMGDAMRHIQKNKDISLVTFLSEDKTIIEIPAAIIYYFEYNERRVKIVTEEKEYICREKINSIASRMEPYGFIMSHQSFVVNLHYVDKISSQFLIMKNGERVYLAQKRASGVRKKLMQIVKESMWKGESKK